MYSNTIYPGYVGTYQAAGKQFIKRKEEDEQSQTSKNARDLRESQSGVQNQSQMRTSSPESEKTQYKQQPQSQYQQQQFPNGQQVAIDYSKSTVNISQIIKDFKNTTGAIGAPEDVTQEVNSYLALIETQALKETPNKQLIKSNLKNASKVLDAYITDTLKKDSNVVENWIDALFLQNIDYKADEAALNPDFMVQIPEKKSPSSTLSPSSSQEATSTLQESSQTPEQTQDIQVKTNGVYIPEDKQLRRMFIQGKKYSAIENDEKALDVFAQTLQYAQQIGDTKAQSIVHYELGQIFDRNDLLPEALQSYNNALNTTEDNNLRTRSHISMAQIYDDVVQLQPAVDHYFAAISFAGEAENLNAQTKALTNLANLYSAQYDKKNTLNYLDLANSIAVETQNPKFIGAAFGKSADIISKIEENAKALDYYKESTRYYTQANASEGVVRNYQNAADIMLKLGDKPKAKTLLEKAYIKSQELENKNLSASIGMQIAKLT